MDMCIPALFHSPGKYMLQENSSSVSLFDALKSYRPNSFSLFRSLSRLFKPCSFENLLNNFHTAPAAARFNEVNELKYGPHAPRFFFPFGSGPHTKTRFFLTLHSAFLKVGILPSESWKINSLTCCSQTVSYTHLDVYKRQILYRSGIFCVFRATGLYSREISAFRCPGVSMMR